MMHWPQRLSYLPPFLCHHRVSGEYLGRDYSRRVREQQRARKEALRQWQAQFPAVEIEPDDDDARDYRPRLRKRSPAI